ncbi:MAG: helix-turn-helix domain-containing protein [Algicola sp.]|nr:helix-turn-helix domain-containing protein [Algicola sp.]
MRIKNTIGSRIAATRKRLGHNQTALARLVGVSAQCVQQWERCETTPRGKNLNKLAATLQVAAQYIQFGTADNGEIFNGTVDEYKAAFYRSKGFEKDYLASVEQLLAAGSQMGWLDKDLKTKAKSLADFGLLALCSNSKQR